MEIVGQPAPVVLAVVAAGVALLAVVACLVDLSRHEVRHLPKWAWALIIVLVNFPIGAIVYVVVGRVPAGEQPVTEAQPEPSAAGAGVAEPAGLSLSDPPTASAAEASAPAPTGELAIATRGLTKTYGAHAALDGVDLAVPRGVIYGLIGPNGAGKTTLLSILAGLRRPSGGSVELAVPRQAMGVLVDTPQFESWLTAREVTDLARHLTAPHLSGDRVDAVLDEVGLVEARDRRVGGFSRGMLQRLGLAACLVGDPEVLLLDEPSSALDPSGRREVLDLVGRLAQAKTVVLSTHILSDVQQVADHVGVIDRGQLRYQGSLAELLRRTSSVYAVHVRHADEGLVAELARQPWVVEANEPARGRLRLVVSDATAAERAIPGLLADHHAELAAFYPATDLETAFLELTR